MSAERDFLCKQLQISLSRMLAFAEEFVVKKVAVLEENLKIT